MSLAPKAFVALVALTGCSGGSPAPELTAVTFNVGTAGVNREVDGYGPEQAAYADEHYGNGLAWLEAIEDVRFYFVRHAPDVVALQEVFDVAECEGIPQEAREGFACDGDPASVPRRVLGPDYQIACHPGNTDKCLAVHARFGRFEGCEGEPCELEGAPVTGCGSGARVARGVIMRETGERLTVVSVHGTSGFTEDDVACRVAQVDQVFVDLGDGEPAASGEANLILGDFNTDPHRLVEASSARWLEETTPPSPFRFVSPMGPDAPRAYAGIADIDHIVSDSFEGECAIAGITEGEAPASELPLFEHLFDHRPVRCELRARR